MFKLSGDVKQRILGNSKLYIKGKKYISQHSGEAIMANVVMNFQCSLEHSLMVP
jgi:hypothetical protein